MKKIILDVCCGGRMFWFDKNNPHVLFLDNRTFSVELCDGRDFEIKPDEIGDFRNLRFPDESFSCVVFDPPHLTSLGEKSWMAKKYGRLNKQTWRKDIKAGFNECFRVLKMNGTLIFKWNEYDIPTKEILKLAPQAPLFGHLSGKLQKTQWIVFMKLTPNP